jgi:hypothetical protein
MYKGPQNTEIKGGFRRPNNITPPTMQREKGKRQRRPEEFRPLFKTILWPKEEGETDELDPEIHCLETLLLFLISLNQHTRSLSWTVS